MIKENDNTFKKINIYTSSKEINHASDLKLLPLSPEFFKIIYDDKLFLRIKSDDVNAFISLIPQVSGVVKKGMDSLNDLIKINNGLMK